jgi:hypothetical protein
MQTYGYLSPKLEVRSIGNGKGSFAIADIPKDEVIAAWSGRVIGEEELSGLTLEEKGHTIQIDDELFLAPIGMEEPSDFINHSCDPNAGLRGQIVLVAMRGIRAGEQICFDYAMSDSRAFDEFDCMCGDPSCRKRITGDDWKLPTLWKKYQGYFSPYLQKKIEQIRSAP